MKESLQIALFLVVCAAWIVLLEWVRFGKFRN